jgi:hypothetical protein
MTEPHDKTPTRQRYGAARRQPTSRSGPAGIKTLITAASIAATVGGWALLAQGAPPATTAAANVSPAPATAAGALSLPPVPTVVPAPELSQRQTEMALRAPSLRSVAAPVPVRREVRAPIAITRSSR